MKWKTLEHKGILFPAEHEHRKLSIRIRGVEIKLTPEQEEMAWAWAKKINTPYVQDEVFQKNFLNDFLKLSPQEHQNAGIGNIDFSEILRCQEEEKQRNSQPEIKKRLAAERKKRREILKEEFGYAVVDGVRTEVANYVVEPPGIFMGRGAHPIRGTWKPRVFPEDVILNLGEEAPIPPSPIQGRSWGEIIHDHDLTWLASWRDHLSEKMKYVWLSDISAIRQGKDKEKYDRAEELSNSIGSVRENIMRGLRSKDEKERKVATVAYLIDRMAMRVGDEKDEDEADTVGATTLRIEHIKIADSSIEFDFLGKDSVRWQKTLKVDSDRTIIENLEEFSRGKNPEDLIFDNIASDAVNRFLGRGMKGLTAKVFRTYQASNEVRDYLKKNDHLRERSSAEKSFHAKMANLNAAIRCNHKRTPPKNWEERIAKQQLKFDEILHTEGKTEKQKFSLKERAERMRLKIDLDKQTKDYNLNTSLRNYIDPRVFKAWADYVDLGWRELYPTALQRKFAWVEASRTRWK